MGIIDPHALIRTGSTKSGLWNVQSTYTGHSFDNSEKGKISAQSINQRQFQYLIYLSKSGKVYLGCQYLGNYGGYAYLADAIKRKFSNIKKLETHSFRTDNIDLKDVRAKEVRVTVSQNGKDITKGNIFKGRNLIVAKRQNNDETFEEDVNGSILSLFGQNMSSKKKKLAEYVNQSGMYHVLDEDIEDCVIVADIGKLQKTIYLFDNSGFVTKFFIDVKLNDDGHPPQAGTRAKMKDILQSQIIAKTEAI
ncbi:MULTISPECIES: hypothetical protein [unclassified Sphingopyxis]|uniref:hypothetical protein n=1 Tax=unclassified Sphingopyxis TaxID=2614943 RepID=UPI0012E3E66D|nr:MULTISPECIES: hypothetical protein [unclassified Sphingopyxis]